MEIDLLVLVDKSRTSRKVLGAMNATFIALTLKKDNPTNFDDF
jgi:hypothetical protein